MSSEPERARLFVALDLPARVREMLGQWRTAALANLSSMRPVAPEALHVTLCFLGWRSTDEIEQIGDACAFAVGSLPAPELASAEPVLLPERRPRVLAVRLSDPSGALVRIQAALSDALTTGGWYARETRPFLPHVTVARVPRGLRTRGVELGPGPSLEFSGGPVTLYRSHVRAGGARYEALRRI